jgi:hypothetical protein
METTTMAKYCKKCGEEIHPKRVKILPNATTCVKCSDAKPKRSITVQLGEGDHTYNELIILEDDEYQRAKYYIDPRAKSTERDVEFLNFDNEDSLHTLKDTNQNDTHFEKNIDYDLDDSNEPIKLDDLDIIEDVETETFD